MYLQHSLAYHSFLKLLVTCRSTIILLLTYQQKARYLWYDVEATSATL